MEIETPWGLLHAVFTVSAFMLQYATLVNNWFYKESHWHVYWPLAFLLMPPGSVIYQVFFLDKPFNVAIEHHVEQFWLYALALSGAWMIGRYKLVSSGKWDLRISAVEQMERLLSRWLKLDDEQDESSDDT